VREERQGEAKREGEWVSLCVTETDRKKERQSKDNKTEEEGAESKNGKERVCVRKRGCV